MNPKLIDHMVRYGIGLDPWFWVRNSDEPNFPPHNIEQLDEDHYRLTLAVAGFAPEEMQITVEGDLLTIKGEKAAQPEEATHSDNSGYKMLYSSIAFRDWTRQFKIGEHVKVAEAKMQHGMLVVDLVREVPETAKPKLIHINA
jgi:molecular chaperone IbpA